MPVIRGFDIAITTSADTSGVEKASSAFDKVKESVSGSEKPLSLYEESMKRLAERLDDSHDKSHALSTELPKTAHEAREAAKGIHEAARGAGELAQGLISGASQTELMSSGLQTMGGLLQQIPVWGAFAGIAIQTLITVMRDHEEASEKSAQAIAKEVDLMKQRVEHLREARREQEGFEASVRRTVIALNAETAAVERRAKAEEEDRARQEKQAALDQKIDEQERQKMVAAGEMTQEQARESKISDDVDAMNLAHKKALTEIEGNEDKAIRDKSDALKEFQALQSEAAKTEERATAARRVLVARDTIEKNKAREEAARANANDLESAAQRRAASSEYGDGQITPQEQAMIDEARAQVEEVKNESTRLKAAIKEMRAKYPDLGSVEQEAGDAMKADKALDARAPGLSEKLENARRAKEKAELDRDAENELHRSHLTDYEGTLSDPNELKTFARFTEGLEGQENRYKYEDSSREREKFLQRLMPEEARRNADSKTGDLEGSLSQLDTAVKASGKDDGIIRKAIEELQKGQQNKGMTDAAQAIIQFAAINNATIKQLAAASRQALDAAKKAQKDVADLAAAAKATN